MLRTLNKPKMSPEDIISKIKNEKGIKFEETSEDEAIQYLRYKNNYFRLASYRKNYDKYMAGPNIGKYIDLDFAYLIELSAIDMHLRLQIIKMCLDIEHSLKVLLLSEFEKDSEDGYEIVKDFLDRNKWIIEDIYRKRNSPYVGDLIGNWFSFETHFSAIGKLIFDKVEIRCPIWAFLEIVTFGEFIKFYDFYYEAYPKKNVNYIGELNSVKSLRNACAHNNCIIHNLRAGYSRPSATISQFVAKIPNIKKAERKRNLSSRPIYEFISLIYLYNRVVSGSVKIHRYEELKALIVRMEKRKHYFIKQQILTASFKFIKKIVDFIT